MGKDSNIVHQYFRKTFEDVTILVKVNPLQFRGTEITLSPEGVEKRELEFDDSILEDLAVDGFAPSSALEFNLYLNGLA